MGVTFPLLICHVCFSSGFLLANMIGFVNVVTVQYHLSTSPESQYLWLKVDEDFFFYSKYASVNL